MQLQQLVQLQQDKMPLRATWSACHDRCAENV
jgi:hypothetical protein